MLPRSPFELLILDCDGVVVDSEPITTRVLTEMLNDLGASIEAEEVAQKFTGHTFARTLELVAELFGAPCPQGFLPNYGDGRSLPWKLSSSRYGVSKPSWIRSPSPTV